MSRTPKRAKPAPADRSPEGPEAAGAAPALSPGETRRGRPRAEALNTLILQGSTSPSSIRCGFCNRVFPREKSLQAHLRTHTGEKPYACDFPRCAKRFAQSGQLKTHKRLHTGEKPFVCSAPNCDKRYTHANRHCPEHPNVQLKRYTSLTTSSLEKVNDEEHSIAVQEWFKSVERKEKRATPTTPKKLPRSLNNGWGNENVNYLENHHRKAFMETRTSGSPKSLFDELKSCERTDTTNMAAQALIELRKGAGVEALKPSEDDFFSELGHDVTSTSSGYSDGGSSKDVGEPEAEAEAEVEVGAEAGAVAVSEIPKKRWRQQWDSTQEDLAQPLNWAEEGPTSVVEAENQKRPTVLVRNDNGQKKRVSRCDMQVAMALVELSNADSTNYTF